MQKLSKQGLAGFSFRTELGRRGKGDFTIPWGCGSHLSTLLCQNFTKLAISLSTHSLFTSIIVSKIRGWILKQFGVCYPVRKYFVSPPHEPNFSMFLAKSLVLVLVIIDLR